MSISQSVVPLDWKKAKVTPIYKNKGSRSDASNYRPISVICHIAKIFEKCIQIQLLSYINMHNFISCDQSAFLKSHSTVTSLHKVVDNWLTNIDNGLITCVCFFDITKCFDAIDHDILLFKLKKYGIKENELQWFSSYLSDRSQATSVHNTLSDFLPVQAGVPQGSILGPVLFLLFINDLPQHVHSCNLYADDTIIERSGDNLNDILRNTQSDIDNLTSWFSSNKLTLSVAKSCFMLIGSKRRISQLSVQESIGLTIGDTSLSCNSSYKYLGLPIDSSLSWNEATTNVCKTLRSRLSALQRLSSLMPLTHINNLYYAFIQSHIDYCLSIWGYTSNENIAKVQRFQNRAARILSQNFDYNTTSESLIHNNGWLMVTERRDYLTLLNVYKALNNLSPLYLTDLFTYTSVIHERITRQTTTNVLYVPSLHTNYMKKSLQYNGAHLWNKLPLICRNSPSLDIFKQQCKSWIINQR